MGNHRVNPACSAFKLCSLGLAFLVLTACGGGTEGSDVGIEDIGIAYIKRPVPRDQNGNIVTNDIRTPVTFNAGGDLYLQTRATANSPVKNITDRITHGRGDVKDISVSFDGSKLVFSLRLEDPNPNDQVIPNWYLYEYDIPSDTITQLTSAGIDNGDDISPAYLPDGRIIFSSNRQSVSKGIRINEGRGNFAAVTETRNPTSLAFELHVRDTDGTIKQVSFNESHDLDPIVLKESGRILFSRWNDMGSRNDISLYTMNPDGTNVQMYYGAHSHRTGQDPNSDIQFTKPREMTDGRILSITRPFATNFGGGDMVLIDGKNFADNTQPIWAQQGSIVTGTAQTVLAQNTVNSAGIPIGGRYNAVFPMLDGSNRFLMSWSQCRIYSIAGNTNSQIIPCTLASAQQLSDPNVTEAPPIYGIYIVDASTQVPIVKPQVDTIFSEIVMTYPQATPPIIFDKVSGDGIDQADADNGVGVLDIRSVYDFDNSFAAYGATLPGMDNGGNPITIDTPAKIANPKNTTADDRPARFIRITKSVSIPERLTNGNRILNAAFGQSTQQGMREIVGYAPIEPDGSVKIKIPANVPLTLGILDKDGRRISRRHQSWFQVKPGETLKCIGCHVHDTTPANLANNKPHGGRDGNRFDFATTFNQGAPYTSYVFPNSLKTLWAEEGETMAETRARQSCFDTSNPCAAMKPSTDLDYSDVWTDDVASNRSADASFTIDYSGVPVSPISGTSQAATACANPNYDTGLTSFTYCRIIINYEQHIEPIWTTTNNRPNGSCVSCHNQASNESNLLAGNNPLSYQLNLVSNPATDDPFYNSFVELSSSTPKFINNGGVIEIEQTQLIINGVPQYNLLADGSPDLTSPILVDVTVPGSIGTGGALNSYFMEKMTNTELNATRSLSDFPQTVDHTGYLTKSELKLVAEWLDMGAQYFNNPLDPGVPSN